jgi:surface antigen/peptidoglycan hydrolase CwlO-like protein
MFSKKNIILGIISLAVIASGGLFGLTEPARADYLCVSAKCLAAEAAESAAREQQAAAAAQKGSYQAEVNRYSAEIAAMQATIDRTQEEIAELAVRIENTEVKINKLRQSISDTVVKLYVGQDVSELELLANSGSLSDLQAKTTNQEVIKGKLRQLSIEAKAAKAELEKEKKQLEIKQQDNQQRKSDNEALRSSQQAFVNEWQGREVAFAEQATVNQQIKDEEREKQRLANLSKGIGSGVVAGDPNHGGYPAYLDNACQDCLVDPWGMYNRECVSYTAWRVDNAYGNMPYWGGRGNAWQWIGNAQRAGIPTSSIPKAGSVGISTAGYYGHAVWVEQVSGGMVYISQYNAAMDGRYSEQWISAGTFTYLYFGDW